MIEIINVSKPEQTNLTTSVTGEVEWESLDRIQIPSYQREEIPKQIEKVFVSAQKLEPIPPIELCVRTKNWDIDARSRIMLIEDPVYIIDGQQRKCAMQKVFREGMNDIVPRLRATVFLGSNETWESDRFNVLNFDPIKVSPSVFMKNQSLRMPSIAMLYCLTQTREHCLFNKVQWSQAKQRQNIFTSLIYGSAVACMLAGREIKSTKNDLPRKLEELRLQYGDDNFKQNARIMFEIYNEIWKIDSFTYADKVIQVKGNFVRAFGMFLGMHNEFWRENGNSRVLMVENRIIEKLKRFPIEERMTQAVFESTKLAVQEGARLFTSFVNKNIRREEKKLSMTA